MSDPIRERALRLVELALKDPLGIVPIVRAGDPVLRAAAVPFDGQLAGDELAVLLDVMQTLAVVEDPLADPSREREPVPFRVLVNPRYEAVDAELVEFEEGCLSVPGYAAVVARHRRVRLVGHDETGVALDEELVGWPARIIQHETDHLRGTLYVDKADLRTLAAVG